MHRDTHASATECVHWLTFRKRLSRCRCRQRGTVPTLRNARSAVGLARLVGGLCKNKTGRRLHGTCQSLCIAGAGICVVFMTFLRSYYRTYEFNAPYGITTFGQVATCLESIVTLQTLQKEVYLRRDTAAGFVASLNAVGLFPGPILHVSMIAKSATGETAWLHRTGKSCVAVYQNTIFCNIPVVRTVSNCFSCSCRVYDAH